MPLWMIHLLHCSAPNKYRQEAQDSYSLYWEEKKLCDNQDLGHWKLIKSLCKCIELLCT